MLEDFIEANSLQAKIVPAKNKGNRVKCLLFTADAIPVILVQQAGKRPDIAELKRFLNCSRLDIPDEKKTLKITGYEKSFIPPISIYGVKVLVAKSLFGLGKVYCLVSETECLEITADEILSSNEDSHVF